jgi:gliding motility-associated-like protein
MYADTGNYVVTLTISDGCSFVSDSMEILIEDAPIADAGPDQTIRPEESVVIGIPSDNPTWEYQWSPGGSLDNNQIPQPVASPTVSTTYVLTVSSANGCSVMDMVTVYVDMTPLIPDQTGQLFVPNIFSPNNDGENDVLYVYGGPFTNFNLVIFNRLGERVFSSTNQEVGWDGRFRGSPAPIGSYYYSLTLTDKDMQTISGGGNITLTR